MWSEMILWWTNNLYLCTPLVFFVFLRLPYRQAIANSQALKDWLALALATGNYLNGRSKLGCAYGFFLNGLQTLELTKSKVNPSGTPDVLEWLVQLVDSDLKRKDMLTLQSDWGVLEVMTKTNMKGWAKKHVEPLKKSIKEIHEYCANKPQTTDEGDRFYDVMTAWLVDADAGVKKMDAAIAGTEQSVSKLMSTYPMSMNDIAQDEFWKAMLKFANAVTATATAYQKKQQKRTKSAVAKGDETSTAAPVSTVKWILAKSELLFVCLVFGSRN